MKDEFFKDSAPLAPPGRFHALLRYLSSVGKSPCRKGRSSAASQRAAGEELAQRAGLSALRVEVRGEGATGGEIDMSSVVSTTSSRVLWAGGQADG